MPRPSDCRVLVVEDNPADAIRVRMALDERGGGAFRTTFAGRISEALPRLRDADLVLLDLSLPDGRGVDSVDRVLRRAPGVPLVVLSGSRDEEVAFRCLQHGAQDVLLKGSLDGDALVRAVRCALGRQALAAERVAASGEREAEWRGALERLAGGVAHELNNQLAVILGTSSRVLQSAGRGSLHADARIIEVAGWRAADVVEQLLACAGRQVASPEVMDLNAVVDRSRDRIERGLPPGASARWRVHPGALKVRADRRLLEQALLILVEHAGDSMPGGGVLTVSTARVPRSPSREGREGAADPRPRVVLAVSDTGPGLGAEARLHLFEPFYSTEVLGIGSGLGMAPVQGIARQSGGETAVESAWGQGTTVRVILPAVEEEGPGGGDLPVASVAEPADLPGPGVETPVLLEEGPPGR